MGGHINFCGRLELCVRTLFILSGDPELSGKLLQPTDQLFFRDVFVRNTMSSIFCSNQVPSVCIFIPILI